MTQPGQAPDDGDEVDEKYEVDEDPRINKVFHKVRMALSDEPGVDTGRPAAEVLGAGTAAHPGHGRSVGAQNALSFHTFGKTQPDAPNDGGDE